MSRLKDVDVDVELDEEKEERETENESDNEIDDASNHVKSRPLKDIQSLEDQEDESDSSEDMEDRGVLDHSTVDESATLEESEFQTRNSERSSKSKSERNIYLNETEDEEEEDDIMDDDNFNSPPMITNTVCNYKEKILADGRRRIEPIYLGKFVETENYFFKIYSLFIYANKFKRDEEIQGKLILSGFIPNTNLMPIEKNVSTKESEEKVSEPKNDDKNKKVKKTQGSLAGRKRKIRPEESNTTSKSTKNATVTILQPKRIVPTSVTSPKTATPKVKLPICPSHSVY